MKLRSERQSSGGSTAWWRHCNSRWVLVKVPAFSTWLAAGSRKTSVPISLVTSSPVSISGPSFQKLAVSISEKSRTTSHFSFAIASRCSFPFEEPTAGFARNGLLARRLLERGVRFVQVFNGGAFGSPRIYWDAHEDVVENHTKQAATLDKPVAGLLTDLKARGLLGDTLVLWTTEFGRTPFTQGVGAKGRDHHSNVFTCWMAGAGVDRFVEVGAGKVLSGLVKRIAPGATTASVGTPDDVAAFIQAARA